MIYLVEKFVERVLEIVGGSLSGLALAVVLVLIAAATLGLSLYKFDRKSCLVVMQRVFGTVQHGWGWLLTAALLLLQVYALSQLRAGVVDRLAEQGKAPYVASETSGGGPTVQRAPHISFLDTTTRSQTLVLPPQVSGIDSVPGWSPEEARYGEKPAVNVKDELVKSDKAFVLNRTIEVQRYVPMKLLSSDVDVRLGFQNRGLRNQFYRADFGGSYTFRNPFPEARRIHFSFPLPDNSGTLSGFRFKVNGKDVPPQDVDRGLDWEMEMKPQEQALVEVGYTHLGAKAWSYDVAGRREPIADFNLKVTTGGVDVKFLRGSLYPTQIQSGTLAWHLQNQITSQSISMFFPFVPTEQIVNSMFVFAPMAAVCFLVLLIVWARLRRTGTSAWTAALAGLACCCGYSLAAYLMSYLPLAPTLVVAFGAAAALQWQVLGNRLLIPILGCALAPFTFLAPGDTGLLLNALGIALLALTIRETVLRSSVDPAALDTVQAYSSAPPE